MLYDPSKQVGTLQHFTAWLQTKPPREKYNFLSYDCCAVGQYIAETGSTLRYNEMCMTLFGVHQYRTFVGPEEAPVAEYPWTFGAALVRCRALQAVR